MRGRHRFSVEAWAASFLAGLGLVACGGSSEGSSGGAAGSGGSSGAAGSSGSSGSGVGGTSGSSAGDASRDGPVVAVDAGRDGAVTTLDAAVDVTVVLPDVAPFSCTGSKPAQGGGGFEICENGTLHRPTRAVCDFEAPDAGLVCEGCGCFQGCTSDADCVDAGSEPSICLCSGGGQPGRCVPAECSSDAQCPVGSLCVPYEPGCIDDCVSIAGFACQSPKDACTTRAECATEQHCTRADGVRQCGGQLCGIGRPFLVREAPRLARPMPRSDWSAVDLTVGAPTVGLDAVSRAAIAEAWTRVALMEHASVAAFARFTLELLRLGAPADLVIESQRAGLDETEHACAAFDLARAFGGAPVGPGLLDVSDALGGRSVETIVETAILEGCVGETVAALEAAQAAELAVDPSVAALLRRIADDERRHAALAWRFVAWAVAEGVVSSEWLSRCFTRALTAGADVPVACCPQEGVLAAWGHVPEARRSELRREALEKVVGPGARALGQAAASHAPRGGAHAAYTVASRFA